MSIRTDTEVKRRTESQVQAESTRAAWKGNIWWKHSSTFTSVCTFHHTQQQLYIVVSNDFTLCIFSRLNTSCYQAGLYHVNYMN